MTGDRPTAAVRSQLGTWRSGAESPAFPGTTDAGRLVRVVPASVGDEVCTLVRVRLATRDLATLYDVRERLLRQEAIVGTSIGREVGPEAPGTFDIVVVPGRDPVTVGRTVAAVDEVVGVAAAAFETEAVAGTDADDDRGADRGTLDGPPTASGPAVAAEEKPLEPGGDTGGVDDDGAVVDATGDGGPESDGKPGVPAVLDDAPEVDGLAALEDGETRGGGRSTINPRGPRAATGDPRTNGGTHRGGLGDPDRILANGGRRSRAGADEDGDDRVAELEARVAELEARLDAAEPGVNGGSPVDTDGESPERSRPVSFAERLDALEDAVEELRRWREQDVDGPCDGSS